MNKIIVTYGLPRTGNTWAFNAVRMIAKKNSVNFKSVFLPDSSKNWIYDKDLIIVKTHQMWRTNEFENIMNTGAAKLIFSVREAASTAISQKRIMRSQGTDARFLELLENLSLGYDRCIELFSNFPEYLIIDEMDIRERNLNLCNLIQDYCELGNSDVSDIAEKLTKNNISSHIDKISEENGWQRTFSDVDWETYWHANHIWKNPEKINWKPAEEELIKEINKKIEMIKNMNHNVLVKDPNKNADQLILKYLS